MTRQHAFGPLELEILGLFGPEDALAAAEVQAKLEARGNELAYTTVMTVLSRLWEKGALSRRREGKRFVYRAAKKVTTLKSGLLSKLQRTLFQDARIQTFTALLDDDALSTEELRAVRRLIDAKLKERK